MNMIKSIVAGALFLCGYSYLLAENNEDNGSVEQKIVQPDRFDIDWDIDSSKECDGKTNDPRIDAIVLSLSKSIGMKPPTANVCPGNGLQASSNYPGRIDITDGIKNLPDCQIAFALGHEIGHLAMLHAPETARFVLDLKGRNKERRASEAFAEMDTDFSLVIAADNLSRRQEFDADDFGVALSGKQGCTKESSGVAFLESSEPDGGKGVSSSHPSKEERIRRLNTKE